MAAQIQPEEARKAAIVALYGGRCTRCPRRIAPGATIVRDNGGHAHLDCVEAGVEPPKPSDPEDLLAEARQGLLEIAKRTKDREDLDQLADDVYERAVGTIFSINEQRTRGRG